MVLYFLPDFYDLLATFALIILFISVLVKSSNQRVSVQILSTAFISRGAHL